jgi:transposase
MRADLFWFSDEQWLKIDPHLPTNQPDRQRHDDRRILSGIMHVQKVGCRWKDCRPEYEERSKSSSPTGIRVERLVCERSNLRVFHLL